MEMIKNKIPKGYYALQYHNAFGRIFFLFYWQFKENLLGLYHLRADR